MIVVGIGVGLAVGSPGGLRVRVMLLAVRLATTAISSSCFGGRV
jgi:hypothetical protein